MRVRSPMNAQAPEELPDAKREASLSLLARAYARWREPLQRLLGWKMRNREDAEDAVQEVFARYAASGKVLPADEQEPYLRTIARNVAHDAWQKSQRSLQAKTVSIDDHTDALELLPADDASDPLQSAQRRERLRRLEEAMAELPERRREAFVLHSIDGLTQTEVAQRMGISRRMVYNHVTLAFAYCEMRVRYTSVQEMKLMQGLHAQAHATHDKSQASEAASADTTS